MNSLSLFLKYARYRYIIHRLLLRIRMGKEKRNEYLQKTMLSIIDFLPERPYFMNGIRAIPRRHTNDFYMLFTPREELLKPHLIMNENETFVDVGANVGSYSLKVATDNKDKSVNIVAIEAHPENYKALCRNIACNGFTNIAAINKAVSENKGIVTMSESLAFGYRTRFETYSISSSSSSITDASSSLQVECDTLDNILAGYKVDLMKIDIEGAEVLALKAATNTLKGLRKIIVEIHEYNFDKVKQILESYNFKLEIIGEDWGEKKMFHGYIIGSK